MTTSQASRRKTFGKTASPHESGSLSHARHDARTKARILRLPEPLFRRSNQLIHRSVIASEARVASRILGHQGSRNPRQFILRSPICIPWTVDSYFQGSEREAIIVSFVRSNSDATSGFLTTADEGPRRLNVALTRGRRRLVVIGDWETLGEYPSYQNSDRYYARLYADLATHISSIDKMLNDDELYSS